MGILTSYGSYNPVQKPIIMDQMIIVISNSTVSFISGFAVWSVVGFLEAKNSLAQSKTSSAGLAFIAYPTAVDMMKWSNFWALLLGLVLFLLGIDSAFAMVEATATVVSDLQTLKDLFDQDDLSVSSDETDDLEERSDDDAVMATGGFDDISKFSSEMIETVSRAMRDDHSIDNAVLEINSLKLVYDRSFADCSREIFGSLLLVANSGDAFVSELLRLMEKWSVLIEKFAPRESEQLAILDGILRFMTENENLHKFYPSVLKQVYDRELVHEDCILEWARSCAPENSKNAFSAAEPFITWLEDADEDDDDENSDDDESSE